MNQIGPAASVPGERPLIVHVVYRFDTGGLENGVVNLINGLPATQFRHVVLALTEVTDFRRRVTQADVEFIALHKGPGHGFSLYPRLYRLFRQLRPAVVHTRNLAALECQMAAWAAGVPLRLHGEHGRDVHDLDGSSRKYQWLRRAYSPFVHRYVALSRELAAYLEHRVGIAPRRIAQVYNGVDAQRFVPVESAHRPADSPFARGDHFVVGSVGRMQAVKNPMNLARAFALACEQAPAALKPRLRLVMVGDGPLRGELEQFIERAGLKLKVWFPGDRADVPSLMQGLDVFVLPSLAEGVSNTILEAMSCGLPVLATEVGGNAELIEEGRTGLLVPSDDPQALADALLRMAADPAAAQQMGREGRLRVERQFSLQAMVEAYGALYDNLAPAPAPGAAMMRMRN